MLKKYIKSKKSNPEFMSLKQNFIIKKKYIKHLFIWSRRRTKVHNKRREKQKIDTKISSFFRRLILRFLFAKQNVEVEIRRRRRKIRTW